MPVPVCLSMIVKNEGPRLERCLRSVLPFLSSYVISDTGSTDNTRDVAEALLQDIPGEFRYDDWVDFGTNRNIALEACAKYTDGWVLTLDADEVLVPLAPEALQDGLPLDDRYDVYGVAERTSDTPDFEYWRQRIVKNPANWRYVGVTHEYIEAVREVKESRLGCVRYLSLHDSHRRQSGQKTLQDIALLEKALVADPGNARTVFYLAQSYKDAAMESRAIAAYQQRIAMGGWAEEVYYSLFQIAKIHLERGGKHASVIDLFLEAYTYRPCRMEALARLCHELNRHKRHAMCYWLAKDKACRSDDILFVDLAARWRVLEEYGAAAYWIGRRDEAADVFQRILADEELADGERARLEKNLAYCIRKAA